MRFPYLLEVVGNFKFILLPRNISLNLRVGVVDDGQEHIKQNKEHEEHVEQEVDRTQDTIGLLQLMEVEVTKDDSEQGKATRKCRQFDYVKHTYTARRKYD